MSRSGMQHESRLMWRLVRDSQPHSVDLSELQAASGLPKETASMRLKFMCKNDYLTLEPSRTLPRWRLGDKLPRGESWLHGSQQVDDEPKVAAGPKVKAPQSVASSLNWGPPGTDSPESSETHTQEAAPKGVPRGVANSVFALGALIAGTLSPAAATGTEAACHTPQRRELFIQPAHQHAQTLNPRFELHSDNMLVIDLSGEDAEPIVLPATVTRALFRWLDRLGGTHLPRLTEEATT